MPLPVRVKFALSSQTGTIKAIELTQLHELKPASVEYICATRKLYE